MIRTKPGHSTFHIPHSAFVVVLFVLALVLRLWCLDCYGLWYDEVASIEIARRGPLLILTDRFGGMLVQTPLHYLLTWLTALPIDPAASAVPVRLPSVLAGALLVPVVYGLGREMFGRATGLIAALLLAVSAPQIAQSQDVRPYALLMLFTSLSVYALLRAERTQSWRWWAAFVSATIAALLISYFGLTLFLPALLPYLAWVVFRLWQRRLFLPVRPALFSLGAIGLATLPVALDVLQVERTPPNLGLLTPELVWSQGPLLLTRLTQVGIGGAGEAAAQWVLFGLACAGAVAGLLTRQGRSVALCALMLVVPMLLLALFKTTNQVFQRYAFFTMPFYLLLIGRGVVAAWLPLFGRAKSKERRASISRLSSFRVLRPLAGAVGSATLLIFGLGLSIYFSPTEHRRFSYLPDYRGAAQHLARMAQPGDTIVLLDEPALGMEVMRFYWRGAPPATVFDARDARLFSHEPVGDVYWVVSFFQNNPEFLRDLPSADIRWSDSASFERILIIREPGPVQMGAGLARLVEPMTAKLSDFQPVRLLRGTLQQALGKTQEAAELYRLAGEYFPRLGAEFYRSAQGFLERGDRQKTWREAITSLSMHPGDPRIHLLLARLLQEEGYTRESQIEQEIGERLR